MELAKRGARRPENSLALTPSSLGPTLLGRWHCPAINEIGQP